MPIYVDAVFENGVFRPMGPLGLTEGAAVRLAISTIGEEVDPLDTVIGVCDEGPDISLAARHDELAYGQGPKSESRP